MVLVLKIRFMHLAPSHASIERLVSGIMSMIKRKIEEKAFAESREWIEVLEELERIRRESMHSQELDQKQWMQLIMYGKFPDFRHKRRKR